MPALRAKLKTLGWVEGQNLVIESAFADAKVERLATLAEELVRKRVDVIWAYPDLPAIAAARATRTIPIVFFNASWPVEQGLIESYGRPGRNVTGMTTYTGLEVSAKRLEFLKAVAPTATRLSWILGAPTEQTVDGAGFDIRPLLNQAARSLGYEVRYHFVQQSEDLDPVFADILASRAQCRWRAVRRPSWRASVSPLSRRATGSPRRPRVTGWSKRAACSPMALRAEGSRRFRPASSTSIAFSAAPVPLTCQSNNRRSTNWCSTSRPPRRSVCWSRKRCCSAPIGSLNEGAAADLAGDACTWAWPTGVGHDCRRAGLVEFTDCRSGLCPHLSAPASLV
jgi:hypothetical protein